MINYNVGLENWDRIWNNYDYKKNDIIYEIMYILKGNRFRKIQGEIQKNFGSFKISELLGWYRL